MRTILFLLIVFSTRFEIYAQSDTAIWNSDLTTALQKARSVNKPVLVVFSGSDWCKPCIMLKEEVLDHSEFISYAKERFVLARFDFPRNKKHRLPAEQVKLNELAAAQLNIEGSFPLVVLLSPEGKVLAKTGYLPGGPAVYESHLNTLLTKK